MAGDRDGPLLIVEQPGQQQAVVLDRVRELGHMPGQRWVDTLGDGCHIGPDGGRVQITTAMARPARMSERTMSKRTATPLRCLMDGFFLWMSVARLERGPRPKAGPHALIGVST